MRGKAAAAKTFQARLAALGVAAAALVAGTAMLGCDRPAATSSDDGRPTSESSSASPASSAPPTTQSARWRPTTTAAAVSAARTRPPAIVTIEGAEYVFPAARIRVSDADRVTNVILFSDDPPEAIRPGYTGNSFYFEIQLDRPLPSTDPAAAATPTAAAAGADESLVGETWHFKAQTDERTDSNDGFFLSGSQYQLQSQDVRVEFRAGATPDETLCYLSGSYLMFDTRDLNSRPKVVAVVAKLPALRVK